MEKSKHPFEDLGREVYLRNNTNAIAEDLGRRVDAERRSDQQARGIEAVETFSGRREYVEVEGPSAAERTKSRRHAELLALGTWDVATGTPVADPKTADALRKEFGHTDDSLGYLMPDGGILPGRRIADFPDMGVKPRDNGGVEQSPEAEAFDLLRAEERKRQAARAGSDWSETLDQIQAKHDAKIKKAEEDARVMEGRQKAIEALEGIIKITANDIVNVSPAELNVIYSAKRHLLDPESCDMACEDLLAQSVAISRNARNRVIEARKAEIAAKEAELKSLKAASGE